jgi:hypothetical protein
MCEKQALYNIFIKETISDRMEFISNMRQSNRKKCAVSHKELKFEILLNVTRHSVAILIRGLNR